MFTHRDPPATAGADVMFVHGDARPVHERMTEAAGTKNVWLVGGGDLVGQFADHGLLDEIHLGVAPVMLGAGAPLLPRRLDASELAMTSADPAGQFVNLVYTLTRS